MPTLDQHPSADFTKLLYIGDSSTGKTGSLVSLLADGYKFRILDMDNGLTALKLYAKQQGLDLSKVEYETFRDEYKMAATGPIPKGGAKAFTKAMDTLTTWSAIEDPDSITVLDSLTFLGKAAYVWARGMNPGVKDPRQWFYQAQQAVETVIALLTGADYKQNVIIISHVNYKEVMQDVHKGYPSAVGSALGPTIASYFDSMVLAEASGSGKNVRRRIKTLPTGVIDLKMPVILSETELPLETGLSTLFKQLKGIE